MALILKKSVFINIPHTGSEWAVKALSDLVVRKGEKEANYASFREVRCYFPKVDFGGYSSFQFVRNPISWWQSRWAFLWSPFDSDIEEDLKTMKWCGSYRWLNYEAMVQGKMQRDDFNIYIESMLRRRPGFCHEYFQFMCATDTVIGKYENMEEDLNNILYRLGEDSVVKDPSIWSKCCAEEELPKYTESNLVAMLKAEEPMLLKFGYSTNIEDYYEYL